MGSTYNVNHAKLVTFAGAKATRKSSSCSNRDGTRIFNVMDPVTGNGLWPVNLKQFEHDIKKSKKLYEVNGACIKRGWWNRCKEYGTPIYKVTTGGCNEVATGRRVQRHMMDYYQLHDLNFYV